MIFQYKCVLPCRQPDRGTRCYCYYFEDYLVLLNLDTTSYEYIVQKIKYMMRMDSIIQAASASTIEEGSPMFVYNRTIRVL
jgi:hypothetical protein